MTNTEFWKEYQEYTKITSENLRKLAFVGIPIIWMFRNDLRLALVLIVGFFILDILQYFVSACILYRWLRNEETKAHKKSGKIDFAW